MSFASPYLLLLLLVVPAVAFLSWWLGRRRARYTVSFTNLDVLASVAAGRRRWRVLVPLALFLLALAAAATAVARPEGTVHEAADRATVVLLVDVSGSMQASDVKPTRLLAAAHAMSLFAARVPRNVRIGLISFSSGPNVLVPPTTDRALLAEGIDLLEPEGGTAIGDGLGVAVQVVKAAVGNVKRSKDGKIPGAIILLSDGAQTRGTLTPLQGADMARRAGIRVFTVALGTNHGTLGPGAFGGGLFGGLFGGSGRFVVRPDPATLAAIARDTDGETFRAQSAGKVESIYKKLGASIAERTVRREITSWFAGAAAALLLASLGAARLTGGRLP
ncbi:MAG TPA: VWA domain-containing protein [Gaiellaceae bacterium]|nr:VWA domain-containing protein [Gaiellaceae bacterium]